MPLKSFSILFIEDDKTTQEQIKMILEDDVKTFFQAYNGKEGLEIYHEQKPDIIITDINLPFVNGLELASIIKEDDSLKPVIVMSAHDDRDTILNSVNLGSDGFIAKPVDVELLYQRLHSIAKTLYKQKLEKISIETKIQELYKLAYFDPLTQVKNMLYFDKKLTQLTLETQKDTHKFSLFYITINNLAFINEEYGYKAGDFILQSLAKSILEVLPSKTLLARKSDDEFLLLYQEYLDKDDLKKLAETILKVALQTIKYEQLDIQCSCSVGISQFPQDTTNKNELLFLAKNAMYHAKNSTKQSYSFASDNDAIFKKTQENELLEIAPNLFWHKSYHQLLTDTGEINLTKKELLFLSLLFNKANYQATHEEITLHLWDDSYLDKKENIKTLVKSLRKKLPFNFITNIFSIGYKINFYPKV